MEKQEDETTKLDFLIENYDFGMNDQKSKFFKILDKSKKRIDSFGFIFNNKPL